MNKTYRGSCHCGKVVFEADIDLSDRWHRQMQFNVPIAYSDGRNNNWQSTSIETRHP